MILCHGAPKTAGGQQAVNPAEESTILYCVSLCPYGRREFFFRARKITPEVKSLPNAKVLSEKQAVVEALSERLNKAASGVLVDYKGITVAEDTALRRELREAGIEYSVVKTTADGGSLSTHYTIAYQQYEVPESMVVSKQLIYLVAEPSYDTQLFEANIYDPGWQHAGKVELPFAFDPYLPYFDNEFAG